MGNRKKENRAKEAEGGIWAGLRAAAETEHHRSAHSRIAAGTAHKTDHNSATSCRSEQSDSNNTPSSNGSPGSPVRVRKLVNEATLE